MFLLENQWSFEIAELNIPSKCHEPWEDKTTRSIAFVFLGMGLLLQYQLKACLMELSMSGTVIHSSQKISSTDGSVASLHGTGGELVKYWAIWF